MTYNVLRETLTFNQPTKQTSTKYPTERQNINLKNRSHDPVFKMSHRTAELVNEIDALSAWRLNRFG